MVLHFHLADTTLNAAGGRLVGAGMVRPEHGSPITVDQVREFLTRTGCAITVQPVIDPADTAPIDAYEISHRWRSRFGRVYVVTNHGTLALGNTTFSRALLGPRRARCVLAEPAIK